ncbi:MAG: hypothetical protein ACR2N4_10420 [Jatrophihabitans sp.]
MWWLLAPVASTLAGAALIGWRGRLETGRAGHGRDPMREHRALLDALPQPMVGAPVPVTMRLLDPAGLD